jgi:hypothetical protein
METTSLQSAANFKRTSNGPARIYELYSSNDWNQIGKLIDQRGLAFVAAGMNINKETLRKYMRMHRLIQRGLGFTEHDMKHISKPQRLLYNPRDPRSSACQRIERCSDRRCYLHTRCAAFAAYQKTLKPKG